ncbi:MAG: methyltransferase [Xanthomonadales bacterium]|nr:methyltransferase [Xanthomonadales bacterium]|tara:strand:- start:201 stop:974 length:774 start_codon:yes stop_codon:yes gene_type:complete
MNKLMLSVALLMALPVLAQEESESERPFVQSIRAAMEAEARTEAERERDANRLPVETLDFFGLDETMTVVELIPGGGWYTKILAPALRDEGKLYVSIGASRVADAEFFGTPPYDRIEMLEPELEVARDEDSGLTTIKPFDLGVENVDAVLTFRNLHNLSAEGRDSMNRAAFAALKPGGIYGVVDHTRRHMQPDDPENRRRVDPVLMIKEIQAAGFEFEAYSDLHYRLDDELRYEVGRKTVTGNTDRFTFLFRKPGGD